jgi:hypothetical protein
VTREERELMAYQNQALWNILECLAKSVTPDQLEENAQLATNLAYFCSALVDQVQLQAFPAGKYKAFKFIMKYLRQITVQQNGTYIFFYLFVLSINPFFKTPFFSKFC